MAEIRLVTFNGETVTPQDDSILYQTATVDGLYNNASFTIADATTIHIGGTFAIMAGRFIEISEQDVSVALSTTQTDQKGQIFLKMDLSNVDTPIDMIVETAATEGELTPITADPNVNVNNSVYMMRLIMFGVSTSTVYNLEDQSSTTIPILANILPISANFTNKNIAHEEKRTSQNAYNVNDLIVYNTTLYKATTAIRVGDVLQEGINIAPTTVASKFGGVSFSIENGKAWVTYVVNGQVIKKALGSLDPATLTATPGDVLSGKLFGGAGSDDPQTGTMPNYTVTSETVKKEFTPSGSAQSYTIPEGYYKGANVVKCKAVSLSGNATAAQVLKNKTFYKDSLTKLTGSMTDYTVTSETTRNEFTPSHTAQKYTIPAGYYSGSNVVKCKAVNDAVSVPKWSGGADLSYTFTASRDGIGVVGGFGGTDLTVNIYLGSTKKATKTGTSTFGLVWTSYKFAKGDSIKFETVGTGSNRTYSHIFYV